MEKLLARLLGLAVLGTIVLCGDTVMANTESVAIMLPSSARFSCGDPATVNVRFNEIKLSGPDSDMVFKRFRMHVDKILFASNWTLEGNKLPCETVVDCARAAADGGFDALAFVGANGWFGVTVYNRFLKCDDVHPDTTSTIYLRRLDVFNDVATVVPFEKAPFALTRTGKVYMLIDYIETNPQNMPVVTQSSLSESYVRIGNVFYGLNMLAVDMDNCLTDGAYGVRIEVAPEYSPGVLVKYLFDECGNTIKVPQDSPPNMPFVLIYSHRGFGCTYYPTDLSDDCTVTFEVQEGPNDTDFVLELPALDAECAGMNMSITGSPGASNENVTDACAPSGKLEVSGHLNYTVSVKSQPSQQVIGFYAYIKST